MSDDPVQDEYADRFARAAHSSMLVHGPAGLEPEDKPPINTDTPVVEPAQLVGTPVFSQHVQQSNTVLNTAGKTPQSREESMNAEKALSGNWNKMQFDFSEPPPPPQSPVEAAEGAVESAIKGFFNPIYAAGYKAQADNLGTRRMLGLANDDDLDELQDVNNKYKVYSDQPSNLAGETVGALVPLAEQIAAGTAVSAVTLGAVKPQWGTALAAGMMQGGATFNRIKELRMADGRPVEDNVARGAALISTALNTGAFLGGEAAISGVFKSLVAKFGFGRATGAGVDALLESAATNPRWAPKLAALAGAELKGVGVVKAYGVLGELIDGLSQDIATTGEKGAPKADWQQIRQSALETGFNIKDGQFDAKGLATQALIAGSFIPFARPWLKAREDTQAINGRDQTLPALERMAQGEAGKAPDHLADMATQMQEAHDPGGPTENVEMSAQVVRDNMKEPPPAIQERLDRADKTGGVVVIPTGDFTGDVLTQKGSDKLLPDVRIGDVPTLAEEPAVAEALKKAKEPNPIDVDTEKVANDMRAKLAETDSPEIADIKAQIGSQFVRVTAVDRARKMGVEPNVFEAYAPSPLEQVGARPKAGLDFQKGVEKIATDTARERRQAGMPGVGEPKKSGLQRLQDLFRAKLGETALLFRTDESGPGGFEKGEAYLSAEEALKTGKKVTPVYVRPEDVLSSDGKTVTTGPLDISRSRPMLQSKITGLFTEEGRKQTVNTVADVFQAQGLRGMALRNRGFIAMLQAGHADGSTFFHEMGHFIHYFLQEYDPARFEALFGTEETTSAQHEAFAESIERYLYEGKPPNAGQAELYQHISRLMRSAYGEVAPGLALPEELTNTLHRLFALQSEVEPMTRVLAPGAEHGILEPKDYLEYEGLVRDYEKTTLNKVSEDAAERNITGKDGERADDEWVKKRGLAASVNKALDKIHAFNLRVLGKKLGFKGDEGEALVLAIKRDVADTLRTATRRDLKPGAYYNAMIARTGDMKAEWGRGNYREAYEAAAQAMRAKEMFEQVSVLKDDTEERIARAKDLGTNQALRAKINLGGKDYQTIMDWTLQSLGLEPENFVTANDAQAAKRALQLREIPLNLPQGFDSAWGLDGQKGGWKSLGSDTLHNALNVVDTAAYLGKTANELRIAGNKVDLNTHVQGMLEALRDVADKRGALAALFAPPTHGLDAAQARESHPGKRVRLQMNDLALDLTKAEGEAKIIDGETMGPVMKNVIQPNFDGVERVERQMEKENKAYRDRWTEPRGETQEEMNERFHTTTNLPNEDRTPIKIFDVVKNVVGMMGDRDVAENFLKGYKLEWNKTIGWLEGLLHDGLIKPEDIDKYHEDRDQVDSHFKKAADIKEKETGVRPPKVPANPFMLNGPDGPILVEGGYWPRQYDYSKAPPGFDAKNAMGMEDPTVLTRNRAAGMDTSFTVERTGSGLPIPLKLESGLVIEHIESVLRYNELRESTQAARKILNHPDMREFLDNEYRGASKLLGDWNSMMETRGLQMDARGPMATAKIARFVHAGVNNYLLAARFGSALHIFGSVAQGMAESGAWNGIKGATKVFFSTMVPGMENEFKRIEGISNEVKTMSHLYEDAATQHVNSQIENLTNPGVAPHLWEGYKNAYRKFALYWFKGVTRIAQTCTYAGAEMRAQEILQEQGVPLDSPEAVDFQRNFSDSVLRQSHGASGAKDTAKFFKDRALGFAFFSNVSSYRNQQFQHVREMGYQLSRGEYAKFTNNAVYNFVLPGAWSAIVRGGWVPLLGIGLAKALSNEDRAKYATSMLVHSTASSLLGTVPIAGDMLSAALAKIEGKGQDSSTSFYGDPLGVPVAKSAKHLLGHIKNWEDAGKIDWEEGMDAAHDLAELGGAVPYSPTRGLSTGLSYLERVYNGEISPDQPEFYRDAASPVSKRKAQ